MRLKTSAQTVAQWRRRQRRNAIKWWYEDNWEWLAAALVVVALIYSGYRAGWW